MHEILINRGWKVQPSYHSKFWRMGQNIFKRCASFKKLKMVKAVKHARKEKLALPPSYQSSVSAQFKVLEDRIWFKNISLPSTAFNLLGFREIYI